MANRPTRLRGVGTRLLLAFCGITAFSALVASAALYSFLQVGHSLTVIEGRVGPTLASLGASRTAERIVSASSVLVAAATEDERRRRFAELLAETAKLRSFLNEFGSGSIAPDSLAPIEERATQLEANLTALDAGVRLRLQTQARIQALTQRLFDINQETQRLLSPTLLVSDSQISRLAAMVDTGPPDRQPPVDLLHSLASGLLAERPVRRVQQQTSDISEALARAAITEQPQRLQILAFQLRRNIRESEAASQVLDAKLRPLFLVQLGKFAELVDGPDSIPQSRHNELNLLADARGLLAENARLSGELTSSVDQLVGTARAEMRAAIARALDIQRFSTDAIAILVALSLATSFLIVWLYVGRNIVSRLNRLSGAILAIAGGNYPPAAPIAGGDEIAAMGRAVEVLRQHAIERDQLLRERAEAAVRLESLVHQRTDELARRQAELRVTFDNMGDGVAMFDRSLRLAAWNSNFQRILKLPDTFLEQSPTYAEFVLSLARRGEFGPDADPRDELRRFTGNAARHYSFERSTPDGRVLEIRHNPVPDGGFVLIYSDITERKRSEAEIRTARDVAESALRDLQAAQANLIQAEKMASLGQLTAGIAHEIKNPLNFVNNFAGLSIELLDELKQDAAPALAMLDQSRRAELDDTIGTLTGNLERIAEHGRRADNIVKSMLEHSRAGTGERRPVDLNTLVEEALNLAYHGARAQDASFNVTLERRYAPELKPIEVAPQEMMRVFLNIITNGFYAASKRARDSAGGSFRPILAVCTREVADAVEVTVRDNGTGIAPEIKDKLFQPFFTTKPTGEGTGLGLSISYDIVTLQHGGSITVDSEPGLFTKFAVRLPRRRPG